MHANKIMNKQIADFKTFFETQLNPEQQQAVTLADGSLLVVAGAGSGKTRVITARIAHLILNEQAAPSAIVALTFTNKAAQEMQHRITHFMGKIPEKPFIGTFHSFCLKFLKSHQTFLDTPFFTILDEDDQQKILTAIIKRNGLTKKVTAKQLSYHISLIKNQSINPEDSNSLRSEEFMFQVYKAYEQEKRLSKALDFDDLLLETVKILRKNTQLLEQVHQSIEHVLVDEYQDTNIVQHELLKLITQKENKKLAIRSICVVGDEDQSIYSWRGATVTNILNFKHDFPHTTIVKIEQNYRSVQPILEVANQVIINNEQRNPKNLWSTRQGTDRVALLACSSEYQEADAVVSFLKMSIRHKPQASHAVLYRAHYQSRALEEALIKRSVPYTIIGGIQFYERKEIKDLLAYMRLIVNPYDRTSFFRVINCPQRGLGQAFEDSFYERWHQQPFMSFSEVAHILCNDGTLTSAKVHSLKSFVALLEQIKPSDKPSTVLELILAKTQYLTYLKESFDEHEAESKIENVKELMQAMRHFEIEKNNSVGAFLDDVALLQEKIAQAKKADQHSVLLMTLHAAKGLEFDHVVIVGLNEDLLPSARSVNDADALEEERRLLYVGITRSRERLIISYARNRHTYGQLTEHLPSRFIREIPTSLLTRYDIGHMHPEQMDDIFGQWLAPQVHQPRATILTFATAQVSRQKTVASHCSGSNPPDFKKNQPVQHAKFGVGIIQEIELKKNGKLYITANFKTGTKKIEASFLNKI